VNRCQFSAVAVVGAMSFTRVAAAQYTLWPEQSTEPVRPSPLELPSPPEPTLPPHFGGARTVLVSAAGGASTSSVNSLQSVATADLDYFFHERLSFGVELWGSTFTYRGDRVESYGLGPRGGYAIPLGKGLTLYPTLGLIYSAMDLSSRISVDTDPEHRGLTLSLDVPFLFHITPRLVAGIGVAVRQDLTNYKVDPVYQTDRPNVGFFLTFGGWSHFGETVEPAVSGSNHTPL
jgi:hypothetical protein